MSLPPDSFTPWVHHPDFIGDKRAMFSFWAVKTKISRQKGRVRYYITVSLFVRWCHLKPNKDVKLFQWPEDQKRAASFNMCHASFSQWHYEVTIYNMRTVSSLCDCWDGACKRFCNNNPRILHHIPMVCTGWTWAELFLWVSPVVTASPYGINFWLPVELLLSVVGCLLPSNFCRDSETYSLYMWFSALCTTCVCLFFILCYFFALYSGQMAFSLELNKPLNPLHCLFVVLLCCLCREKKKDNWEMWSYH